MSKTLKRGNMNEIIFDLLYELRSEERGRNKKRKYERECFRRSANVIGDEIRSKSLVIVTVVLCFDI